MLFVKIDDRYELAIIRTDEGLIVDVWPINNGEYWDFHTIPYRYSMAIRRLKRRLQGWLEVQHGQLSHTPGPVIATGGTIQVDSPPHFIAIVGHARSRHRGPKANARLLAAAYNAFDSAAKNLGINAVEFAERMQESGLPSSSRHWTMQ